MPSKMIALTCVTLVFLACGGEAPDESDRDITLAPAESIATLDDAPQEAPSGAAPSTATPRATPPPPPAPRLDAGTAIAVYATDTITSRTDTVGTPVTAAIEVDLLGADGRVVIPAGSVLEGTVTEIKPAPNPEASGLLSLTFTTVRIGGERFAISADVDSLGTQRQGRGVTGGDAAKVGVGAAAGAIAGRVIGGDATGTVVGGVIGAATGAGVAAITKDSDIVLPAGAEVVIVLNAPFIRSR